MRTRRIRLGPIASPMLLASLLLAACGSKAKDVDASGGDANQKRAASAWEPERVTIHDHWMGLEGDAPHDAVYILQRGLAGAFTGTASLTRGAADWAKKSGPLPVTVPDSAMRAFLAGLAGARLREGRYEPRIDWTDDDPEMTVRLHAGTDSIEVFSASQPRGRACGG